MIMKPKVHKKMTRDRFRPKNVLHNKTRDKICIAKIKYEWIHLLRLTHIIEGNEHVSWTCNLNKSTYKIKLTVHKTSVSHYNNSSNPPFSV